MKSEGNMKPARGEENSNKIWVRERERERKYLRIKR